MSLSDILLFVLTAFVVYYGLRMFHIAGSPAA